MLRYLCKCTHMLVHIYFWTQPQAVHRYLQSWVRLTALHPKAAFPLIVVLLSASLSLTSDST